MKVLLVGVGGVGEAIAVIAKAFGVEGLTVRARRFELRKRVYPEDPYVPLEGANAQWETAATAVSAISS